MNYHLKRAENVIAPPDFVYCFLLLCESDITSSDKQTVSHSSINQVFWEKYFLIQLCTSVADEFEWARTQ